MTYLVHICSMGHPPESSFACETLTEVREVLNDLITEESETYDFETDQDVEVLPHWMPTIVGNHLRKNLFARDLDCLVLYQHRDSLLQIQVQRVDDYEEDEL